VHTRDGKTWELEKRFKEFDALHATLKKLFTGLPELPGKSLLTLKEAAALEKRREGLEKYLQVHRNRHFHAEMIVSILQVGRISSTLMLSRLSCRFALLNINKLMHFCCSWRTMRLKQSRIHQN
jgi:hypothetical protein